MSSVVIASTATTTIAASFGAGQWMKNEQEHGTK
jgi:hypothetical protein